MKIRPVGAEFLQADRRTDMTKLIVSLRNFANAPKTDPKKMKRKQGKFIHPNIRTSGRVLG
jgi:hypothetical protein